jgi:mRNA interferase MazF
MQRGEIRWYRFSSPDKKRPVLLLTRDSVLEYLGEVTIAPITTTMIRDIPSEVLLKSDDGMPRPCAISKDVAPTSSPCEPLAGTWFDRTQEYLARRKGEAVDRLRYTTRETVTFSPLPCWKHLSPEAYRQRVSGMAAEIEEDAAATQKRTGTQPLGAAAILAQDPTSRPKRLRRDRQPTLPRGEQGRAPLSLRGLRLVRGGLPARLRRSSYEENPARDSPWELSAGVAVRRRVGRGQSPLIG